MKKKPRSLGTEKQRGELHFQRLSAELERRVAQRTAELEAANKELEAFSYSVSHDLRAPLRHIEGFVEILLSSSKTRPLDEDSTRCLETIAQSARRMARLMDDLLAFSRTGRTKLTKTALVLTDLVRAVVQDLREDAAQRDIQWVIGDLPMVEADPALLRQVLVNLLGNALKYTRPQPRARIEIGSQPGPTEDIIYVRDNGVGFDARYAHKLFGVFQRLHREEEFEGTGIGLANVRRIIHRHGGRTWAEGEVDRGATFFFSLPRAAGTSPE
ncbi:MAG: sensor histidine kinase [Limisphaerales bacterium]